MLTHLTIIDLAVVKSLNLELHEGMTVLTGETGAGKSILLTALGLALGDRADSGFIRPDAKRAEIHLEFDISHLPHVSGWLQENDLDDDDHCLIRRIVADDGRSKAYINNRPVTLQLLQALSEMLVQILGQHAHLTLLNNDEQRRLLDAFGKNQPLVDKLNTCYREWLLARKELDKLSKANFDRTQREEFLRFQIEELQQIDFSQFDYAQLTEEHSKLANMENILAIGQRNIDSLYENDQISVNQMLNQSVNDISQIAMYAPELNQIAAMLSDAQIQTEEAAMQLRRFLNHQESEPQKLSELEAMLATLQKLSRKHHVSPQALPEFLENLENELDGLSHSGERIEGLTQETQRLQVEYDLINSELSERRQQQALTLQQAITDMIQELGMPQGEFIVDCTHQKSLEPRLHGTDKIEFLVCANPGLPPKPLAKVASGGELSRISLAIQVTTSNDKTTPTMIFDEVDSGIGGGIAEIVGQKLHRLGNGRQVICVTHLPQVAAQADHHLYVYKHNESDMTSSTVKLLNLNDRIEEIARMLGGITITENTRAHAKEMLTIGNSLT